MKKKGIQPPHEHHLEQKREEWRHIVVFGCECGYEHEVVILGEKPDVPGAVEEGRGILVHDQHDNLVAVIPDEKPDAPVPEPDWEGIASSAAENRDAPAAPDSDEVCECGHPKNTMIVCYHDEKGETRKATIPVQTCDHCYGEELHYIEADLMRASIACFCCDFQKWVEFDDDGKAKDGE